MMMTTELKQAASAMATNGSAAARQVTSERAARTRGLMQNDLKPTTEAFAMASHGAAEFGRGNFEAVAQSTQAYLTGMREFGRQYIAAMQGLTLQVLDEAKAFAAVKTPKDVFEVQAHLARGSTKRALAEGVQLQQAALKLTQQVYAPLTRRATLALERPKLSRAA